MKKREETKKVEKVEPIPEVKGKVPAIKEEAKRDVSPDKKGAKGK